jgi:RNA recognition motif-containing protein
VSNNLKKLARVSQLTFRLCSVAYVEFIDIDDVRKAINLTGTKLLGLPIVVQYTEAERNRQAGLVQQRQSVPEHIQM